MHITIYKGIAFIEGIYPEAKPIEPIEVSIGGFLSQSQLKTLNDVKDLMVDKARQMGANAIVDFSYGQKSPSFLGSIFNLDDVNWYGRGIGVNLLTHTYQTLVDGNSD